VFDKSVATQKKICRYRRPETGPELFFYPPS